MTIKGKSKIDIFFSVCIVLMAMYFMHLSQFFLPIMCLIIFVKDRYRIVVRNKFLFVILCLFGISFFIFSYKQGFYSTMGFCLPMAYYVGENLCRHTSLDFKTIVYLVVLGMGIHVLLNFAYDFYIYGPSVVTHRSHYDIWLRDKVNAPTTAVNYVIPTSCAYYILFRENNKKIKVGYGIMYSIMMIYNIFLGRRTPLLMLGLVLGFGLLIECLEKKSFKKLFIVFGVLAFVTVIIFLLVATNFNGFREMFFNLHIVSKFVVFGLDAERLEILLEALKYMPEYPWGGQNISQLIGIQIHDLWTDIYDYAGVIPFVLMIIYFVVNIMTQINLLKSNGVSKDLKIMSLFVFICCLIQMMLEPIMTGSSIFLISFVMIFASVSVKTGRLEHYHE